MRTGGQPRQGATGAGAAATRFGTDPAVLVVTGMTRTAVGAAFARRNAGREYRIGQILFPGLTGQHVGGGATHRRAIKIGADAIRQRGNIGLRKARIGTGHAGLGAIRQFGDRIGACMDAVRASRAGAQQLVHMHGDVSGRPHSHIGRTARHGRAFLRAGDDAHLDLPPSRVIVIA